MVKDFKFFQKNSSFDPSKKEDRIKRIVEAHERYVTSWCSIDGIATIMGAMTLVRFCESLLTYDQSWWNRWMVSNGDSMDVYLDRKMVMDIIKRNGIN